MASRQTSAATNVLVMLATEKMVSTATFVPEERIAVPETPVHIWPSGKTIAADIPGYRPPLRMESRAAWRAVAVAASRWVAGEAGAACCEVGTGTMETGGVGVELGVGTELLDAGVALAPLLGDGVAVAVPHAATTATSRNAAARRAGT
jgi:hypothetical protein